MAMRFCQTTFSLVLAVLIASPFNEARADQPQVSGNIQAIPSALKLVHHRHEHSLTISGRTADGFAVDLSQTATMTSADPSVAVVENGWVRPLKW